MPSENELKSMPRRDLVSRAFMWHNTHGMEQDLIRNTMVVRHHIEADYEFTLDQVLPQSTSAGSKLADSIGLLYIVLEIEIETLYLLVFT